MSSVTSYIKKSPTGFYSYRRRVPDDCRSAFGKREEKKSLKTKSHSTALLRGAAVNDAFETEIARIRRENGKGSSDSTQPSVLDVHFAKRGAEELLQSFGIHPTQVPDFRASEDEVSMYGGTVEEFFSTYEEIKHEATDPVTGTRTYKDENPANRWDQAARIIRGEQPAQLEPTLHQCVELYLEINQEKKQRSEHNKKKHDQSNWRAVERLASFLETNLLSDLNTPLSKLTKPLMREYRKHLQDTHPEWAVGTLNKEIQRLQAIFNCGSEHFELNLTNPFSGLQLKRSKRDRDGSRRSFSPAELEAYLAHTRTSNAQVRLIALVMAHTGCRTMEAAGLTVGEVKVDANTPYIKLRHNRIRSLKNDASERDLPLVGSALEELRGYLNSHEKADQSDAPLFSRYGRDGGMDSISQILNRIIRKKMGIEDRSLVAYSTRHAMKDKLRAIHTPEHIQHAILGHASQNAIAGGYGSGERLEELQRQLHLAYECGDWGNF